MSGFFFVAMIVAMFATLGILAVGMVSMIKGGDFNVKYGNKLMRARVPVHGVFIMIPYAQDHVLPAEAQWIGELLVVMG